MDLSEFIMIVGNQLVTSETLAIVMTTFYSTELQPQHEQVNTFVTHTTASEMLVTPSAWFQRKQPSEKKSLLRNLTK